MENTDSPFYNNSSMTIVMYIEPFLNTFYKTYQNIITLSSMPTGPLSNMVSIIPSPKLSPFQNTSPFSNNPNNCLYVLLRYPKNSSRGSGNSAIKFRDSFMFAEDIPSVFSYLRTNGYIIDTDLTKMMNKSRISIGGVADNRLSGDRKMICMFSCP